MPPGRRRAAFFVLKANWNCGVDLFEAQLRVAIASSLVRIKNPVTDTQHTGSLTSLEKRVVKALLADGKSSQDIHAIINYERPRTVNFGRISGVKKDDSIPCASPAELSFFYAQKKSFDPTTGLNLFGDERLIRAREAMILAVMVFNSAGYKFKTELFVVQANIAWTYLLHEFYYRIKKVDPLAIDGSSHSLGYMIEQPDCKLSKGIKNNLKAIKILRDQVEHHLLGRSDLRWLTIFQACCLNFDATIVDWFGPRLTLQHDLSMALHFGKMQIEQAAQLMSYDTPAHIAAVDALLSEGMTPEEIEDLEYQFRVVYTLTSASKNKSHIQFIHPDSAEGKDIHNIVHKIKIADDLYPYKPKEVVALVCKALNAKSFSMQDHTHAWKKYSVRPSKNSKNPDQTNRDFCIYHAAHGDYTYNNDWISRLINDF